MKSLPLSSVLALNIVWGTSLWRWLTVVWGT